MNGQTKDDLPGVVPRSGPISAGQVVGEVVAGAGYLAPPFGVLIPGDTREPAEHRPVAFAFLLDGFAATIAATLSTAMSRRTVRW